MRDFIYLFFLLATSTLSAQAPMTATEALALRKKVKAVAQKTSTITSDFTQFKHLDFIANDIESNGRLIFKAPNWVKWTYTSPFAYSILFKDDILYINDDGNKSDFDLSGNKAFEQLSHLITASISGDMFDTSRFDIAYFADKDKYIVHFSPKDPQFSEFIKLFQLNFNDMGEVDEVKMVEPSGDYTRIVFANRIANEPLSDADFTH